jgi:DNA-binding response OmpR family regulator
MASSLRILIVEDNDELRETTAEVLRGEGHHVVGVDCAEAVSEQLGAVDLMLIDLNLPGEDGLALASRVRVTQPDLGIIMMTARILPAEKKLGYESGADIYIPKPVAFEELTAAISSLARRLHPTPGDDCLGLNQTRLVLEDGAGHQVAVTPCESTMLIAFTRAREQRLENWQLIELLKKDDAQDPKAALELQIVRLRKKLQQAGATPPSILSIRGWGYQLCMQIRIH